MNITVERLPECQAKIRVQVPRDTVESQREGITKQYHQYASVPGFRPGKAPLSMVSKRFAKQIQEELKNRLIGQSYQEGSKSDGLRVITPLDVKEDAFHDDGSFSVEISVMVAPEFELPNYKGLEINAPKIDVTDEKVTKFIDEIRQRDAAYPEIEDRGAAEGDIVIMDYHGYIDGRPVREVEPKAPEQLQQGSEFALLIKEPHFMAGFCTQLIGLKPGDNKQVKVAVPKELPFASLTGKEISYDVEVKKLHRVELPEVNEEYLKRIGVPSLEELQKRARDLVTRNETQKAEAYKAQQVVDQLNQAVGFELPERLVNQATWQRAQQLIRTNAERGVSQEQIDENGEEIMKAAREQAQYDVKTRFILSRIAEQEKIQVSNQEAAQELYNIALQRRLNKKADINKLMKDENLRQQVIENILTAKTIGFIIKEAKLTEVDALTDAEVKS